MTDAAGGTREQQRMLARLRSRWPGRIMIHGVEAFVRLDMFDRSMTIAAQFFTFVLPILILFTTWADSRDADRLADALNLPEETRSVLEEAIQGAGLASFCFLATAILGQVISTDRGRLSQWIQGTEPAKDTKVDSDGT